MDGRQSICSKLLDLGSILGLILGSILGSILSSILGWSPKVADGSDLSNDDVMGVMMSSLL